MSATGISGKPSGDKNASGKAKFNALNINNVFSGKSLVNPKANTTSKHGLQSLGKSSVVVRRMPPPANLPSIKSQVDPEVSLVPTGGLGWGSQASNNEQSALNQQHAAAANVNQGANLHKHSTAQSNVSTGPQAGQAGGWKTTDVVEPPSSYNARDFPHLVGDGDGATRGSQKGIQQSSSQPSLRPQNVASWKTGGGRNIPHTEIEEEEEEQAVQNRTGAQRAPEDRSPSGMVKDRDRSPASQDQSYRPPSASHPGFMPPPPFGIPPPRGFQPPFPYHQHPPYPYPPPMPPMPAQQQQQRAPAPQKGFPPTSSRFQPGYSGNRRAPQTESNDDNDRNRERQPSYMPQRNDRMNGDNYENRVVWSDDEHGGEEERTRKSPRYRNQRPYAAAPPQQHPEPAGYYSDEDMYHQQDRGHRDRNYYRGDYHQMPPPMQPPQGYQMPPMPPNWYPPPYPPPSISSETGSDRPMQPPMHGMMRPPPLLGPPPPRPYGQPRVDDEDEDAMQMRQQLTKREQAIGRSSRRRLAQQTSMSSDHDLAPSEHGSDDIDRPESHDAYAKNYQQSNRRQPQHHQQQQAPRFQRSGHVQHAEQAANYQDSSYRSEYYPRSEGNHDRQYGDSNRRRERELQNQSDSHNQYQAADDSKRLVGSDRSSNNVVESETPYETDEIHRQVLKRPESRDSTASERSSIRANETRSRAGTGHDRIPVVVEEPSRKHDLHDVVLEKQMENLHIESVVIEEEEIVMEKLDKPKVIRRSVDTSAGVAIVSKDAVSAEAANSSEKNVDAKHKGEDSKSKKSNDITPAIDEQSLKPAPEPAVNVWAQRQAERASQDRETGWPSVIEETPTGWNFDRDEFKEQDSEWIEEDEYSKSTKRQREQQAHRPHRGRSMSNRVISHRVTDRGRASHAASKAQRNVETVDFGGEWGAPKNQRGGVGGASSSQPGRRKREHDGDESSGKLVIGEWHNEEAGADGSRKQDNKGHDSDRQHSPESHKELKGAAIGHNSERGRRRGGSQAAATANNRRSTSAFDNEWDPAAYSGNGGAGSGYSNRSRGWSSSAARGGKSRGRSNYSIPPLFGASRRGGYNNSSYNGNRDYYNYNYYDYNYDYDDGENQQRSVRSQTAKERPRRTTGGKKSVGMSSTKKHSNSGLMDPKESSQKQAAGQSTGNFEAAKSPTTSDYADDWETASESSGVGDRSKHPHASGNDFPTDGKGKSESGQYLATNTGKSFSRQRPSRRGGTSNAQSQHASFPKNVKCASHQVADYHKHSSQRQEAVRGGSMDKSAVVNEKLDALAQVDINNIAGVFVIDDQPDTGHLEVFDDGFQLVSRKKPKKDTEDPRSRSNSRTKPQKARNEKPSSGIGRSNTKQQTQLSTSRSSVRQIPQQLQPAISTPDKEIKSEIQNSTKTVSAAVSRPTVTFTDSSYFSSNEVPAAATQIPSNTEPAVTGWDFPIPSGLPGISFGSFGSPSASLSSLPSKTGVEIWGTPDPAPTGLLIGQSDQSKSKMDSKTDLEPAAKLDSRKATKDFQNRLDRESNNQQSPSIQLEFTYEETTVSKAALQSSKTEASMVIHQVVKKADSVSPDDLNQKIAAVKNVWDRDGPSQGQQNNNSAVSSLFASSSDMEQESSHASSAEKAVTREIAKNDFVSSSKDPNQTGIQIERSYPSNVAKVRPQPQQIQQTTLINPIGSLKEAMFGGGNAMNLNFQSNYAGLPQQATLASPIHGVSNAASLFAQAPLMKQENAPMQLSGYAAASPSNLGGFIMPSLDRPMSASNAGANWPLPPQAVSNSQNGAYMMGQPAVAVNSASGHSSVGFGRPPSNPAAVSAVGSMFMLPLIDTSQPPPPIMNFGQPPLPPAAALMGPSLLPHAPSQTNAAPLQIQSIPPPKPPSSFMLAAHGTQAMPPQAPFATPAPVASFVNHHPPGPIQPPIGTQSSFGGAKWHEGGNQAPGFGRKGSRNTNLPTSSSPNQQGLLGPAPGSQKFPNAAPMLNVIQPIAPAGTIGIGNVPGFGVPPQLFQDRSVGMNVNGRTAAAAAPSFGGYARSTYYKQDQRRDKDLLQDIDRFLSSGGESTINDDQSLN